MNNLYFKTAIVTLLFLFSSRSLSAVCPGQPSFSHTSPRCIGNPILFTYSGLGIPDTLIWQWGDGTPDDTLTGITPVSHIYASAGSYSVLMIRNCSMTIDTASQVISVCNYPKANFVFNPNMGCSSDPVFFTSTSSGNGCPLSYHWYFDNPASGGTNTSNQPNPSHIFVAYGTSSATFNVQLVVTTSTGCKDSVTYPVTVLESPDPTIHNQRLTSCGEWCKCIFNVADTTFTVSIVNGSTTAATNTFYSISWGDGSPDFNAAAFPDSVLHTYNQRGIFPLVFTVSDNQCVISKTYQVFNGSNPQGGISNIGNTTGLCGLPKTIYYTFQPNTSVNSPGTIYTIQYDDGSPSEVYSHPPPDTLSHTFTSTSCGHTSFLGTANSFGLKCIASNPCGVTNSIVDPIQIGNKPDPNFTVSPASGCVNQPVVFTSTSTSGGYINPVNGQCDLTMIYHWTITPAAGWTITSGNAGSAAITVSFNTPGNFDVTLETSNPCGNDIITKSVCVSQPPISSFTLNKTTGCLPLSISTTNNSTVSDPCAPIVYTWSVTNYTGSASCPPNVSSWSWGAASGPNSVNPSFIFNNPGTYRINLAVQSGCGTVTSFQTVTVKSPPGVNITAIPSICEGQTITPNGNFSSCWDAVSSYSWLFPGGNPASSTLQSPGTITYPSAGNYIVTASAINGCGTTTDTIHLTVKPLPVATATPGSQSICSNGTTSISLGSTIAGTTFSWTVVQSAGISGALAGSGSSIIQTLVNSGFSPGTATYTVTPSANGCPGLPMVVIITVNPIPDLLVNPPATAICSGLQTSILLSSNVAGTSFSWTTAVIAGTVSGNLPGSGSSILQTLVNTGNITAAVRYTITPSANGCAGVPLNYDVTVYPQPIVTPAPLFNTICSGQLTGITLSSNVTIPAAVFTWTAAESVPPASGAITGFADCGGPCSPAISQTLLNSGNTDGVVTYTIAATANGCTGTPVNVNVTVHPVPNSVCNPVSQDICSGTLTAPVLLTSNVAGTTYSWTGIASSPGITGFTAGGSGPAIPAQTIFSTLILPGTVTYTVTPAASGCAGTVSTHTITVNPAPMVTNSPLRQRNCSATATTAVNLTSNIAGATFTWQPVYTPVTLSGFIPGIQNTAVIPSMTILNSGTAVDSVIYQVTPVFTGSVSCPGVPVNYTFVVDPMPAATATPANPVICSGQGPNIALTSNVSGTTFTWSVVQSGVTGGTSCAAACGSLINQVLTVTGFSAGTATYNIIPSAGTCTGVAVQASVTVSPAPNVLFNPPVTAICSGIQTNIGLTSDVPGTTFSWTTSVISGSATGNTAGSGSVIQQTIINTGNVNAIVRYSVTPAAVGCTGVPYSYDVTVYPVPQVTTSPLSKTICSGVNTNIPLASNVAGAGFTWTVLSQVGAAGASAGAGTVIGQVLTATAAATGTVTYQVTAVANGCPGPFVDYTVLVNPLPDATILPASQEMCSGANSTPVIFSSSLAGTTWAWDVPLPHPAGITPQTWSGTSSNIPSQLITSTLTAPGTLIYNIIPSAAGCTGATKTHTITINPTPAVTNAPLSQGICSGSPSSAVILTSNVPGTTFSWTATPSSPLVTGFIPAGTNTIPSQIISNGGIVDGTITYHIIPAFPGSTVTCNGTPSDYVITVKPKPVVTSYLTDSLCSGNPFSYTITSNVSGSSFGWSRAVLPGISNPAGSGATSLITETLFNTTSNDITVPYKLWTTGPGAPSCVSDTAVFNLKVKDFIISAGPDFSIPFGTNTMLGGTAAGGAGNLHYAWAPAADIQSGINTLSPVTTNLYAVTTFTLTVTENNMAGCSLSDNVTVTLAGSSLAANPSVDPPLVCPGGTAQLFANPTGGSGTYTYAWTSVPPGSPVWTSTDQDPYINPQVPTTYTVFVNDGFNSASGSISVSIKAPPAICNMNGGGQYCAGGAGLPVGLSNSEVGATYQLSRDGVPSGPPMNGTGTAITFGTFTTSGTYTATATSVSTPQCTSIMAGSSVINIIPLPTPFSVIGGGSYPAGGIGVEVGLSDSETGVEYELVLNGMTPLLPRMTGTGNAISFGYQTAAGTYTVTAYTLTSPVCPIGMTGSVQVIINPWPALFTLNGGGGVCADDSTGAPIWLDGSEIGIDYQLKRNGNNTGPAIAGTGDSLFMGYYNEPGMYTATGTNIASGLLRVMNGNAVIVINPLPFVFVLSSFGDFCPGSQVVLNGSQTGVNYVLLLNSNPVDTLPGTGTVVDFGSQAGAGNYSVLAYFTTTGCDTIMEDTIHINPSPVVFDVRPPGISCAGDTVTLTGSQAGILYQLRRNGLFNVGLPIPGNGFVLNFGQQNLPGIYTVEAINPLTNCNILMNGSANLNNLPVSYSMVPQGDTCAGAVIGINGSQTGILYILKRDGLWTDSIPGTGFPVDFGPQTVPGVYTITGVDTASFMLCNADMAGSATIQPGPVVFNIYPAGLSCAGDPVGISGSEPGVNYQLVRNGWENIGLPIAGNGLPLSFGIQVQPGLYTVLARSVATWCWTPMSGSANLVPSPDVFAMIPAGDTCAQSILGLNGSQPGVKYSLLLNNVIPVITVTGTGAPISFGTISSSGTYTVEATNLSADSCKKIMSGNVIIHPNPIAFSLIPTGTACAGTDISISGSQAGISYQLLRNNIAMDTVPGTGGVIDFGIQALPGIYTVAAQDDLSGCYSLMAGSLDLIPLPSVFNLIPAGDTCELIPIGLTGSQAGINYTLRRNGIAVETIAGTGAAMFFVYATTSGTYTVQASKPGPDTCSSLMNGSFVIHPLPLAYDVIPGGANCEPVVVGLSGSQPGVAYELFKNGMPTGIILPGTGGGLSYPPQMAGSYTISAGSNSTPYCRNWMNGTVSVNTSPWVNAGPDDSICSSQPLYPVFATGGYYSTISWITSGDGFFTNGNSLTPVYNTGTFDRQNRMVLLIVTLTGTPACPVSSITDTIRLVIDPLPVANAGPDRDVCENDVIQLSAAAQGYSSLSWTTGGDGIFSNNSILNPTYTPGPADLAGGSVQLYLTAFGRLTCGAETDRDTVVFTIWHLPTANIHGNAVICAGDTTSLSVDLTGTPPWTLSFTDGVNIFTIPSIGATPLVIQVAPLSTTAYTLTSVSDLKCTGTSFTGSAMITVNPRPLIYDVTVTDGGIYCEGGTGVTIGLTNSQAGIRYKLMLSGIQVANSLTGTGFPLSFGLQTAPGIYTITGYDSTTALNCSQLMNGTATVVIDPLPVVDFIADSTCIGDYTYFGVTGPDTLDISLWEWDFGDGITANYNFAYEPVHLYPILGDYQVTLRVTNIHGCQRTIIHNVNIMKLPVAVFSISSPTCQMEPVEFTDHSYSLPSVTSYVKTWIWNFGDGTTDTIHFPAAPDVSHLYASPGNYSAVLTIINNKGCTDQYVHPVTIMPDPVANYTYSTAQCTGQMVDFTDLSQTNGSGQIIEWYWNFGDPLSGINNTSTEQNPGHQFTFAGIFQVTLAITNTQGCKDTVIQPVNIINGPDAAFSANQACLGGFTQFTDLSVANSASILSWDWDFGDGSLHSNLQNPVHLYLNPGVFQVTLSITNSNQCVNDTVISVNVIPLPTAEFHTNAPQCLGYPVTYTNQSITSHGQIVKWVWDFGDGYTTTILFPATPDVTHTFLGNGSQHLVRLTVYTSDSCSSYKERLIISSPSPVANYSYSSNTCADQAIQFNDISQLNGGGIITTWYWNFDDPLSGTSNISWVQNPVHQFTASGTYDVMLIITNDGDCKDTIIKQVQVSLAPVAAFSSDTACFGTLTHFTDLSVANASSITAWDWNFGDGTPHATVPNPSHLYSTQAVFPVTLTVTNSNGCIASITLAAHIAANPLAAFSAASQNCSGAPVQFSDFSSTQQGYLLTWTWDFGDGITTTFYFPPPQYVYHTYAAGGTYNVTLAVGNSNGCSASVVHPVNVNFSPLANFDYSAGTCENEPVQFNDLTQTGGGGSILEWHWNFGDPGSGTGNFSQLQNPVHIFSSSGNYQVTLIVKNINFCLDTIIKPVVVTENPAASGGADTVCKGFATQFTDYSAPAGGNITGWMWNFGDGSPASTLQNPSHLYALAGSYNVTLSVLSSAGCSDDTTFVAVVRDVPAAMFSYTGSCAGSATGFTDESQTPEGAVTTWLWNFGDGDTSSAQNPVHLYQGAGTYSVTLRVTNSGGCLDSIVLPVVIKQRPDAEFAYFSTFCPAGQVTFTDHSVPAGSPIVSWFWEFEPGFFSTSANPTYTYSHTDTSYAVMLIVTDFNGCQDTIIDSTVIVKPGFAFTFNASSVCIGLPTTFSPVNLAQGDTLHDLFWNFGEPGSGTNNTSMDYNPVHTYSQPGSYIVSLRAYNSENCVDSIFRQITVRPLPTADFSYAPVSYCDSVVTFTNISSGNGSEIDSLYWDFGDGNIQVFPDTIPATLTHQYPGYDYYQVTVTAVNAWGCRDTKTGSVHVSCVAAAFEQSDTLVCQNIPVFLHDTSSPVEMITGWTWNFGDGTDTTYTQYAQSMSHVYENPGLYALSLVVNTGSGSYTVSDTSMRIISVKPSPVAAFSLPQVCFGDTTRFINLSDSNGTVITRHYWSFGDPGSGLNDTSTMISPSHRYLHNGSYDVLLIIRNNYGCVDTTRGQALVHKNPVAAMEAGKACARHAIEFTDLSAEGDTLIGQWTWKFGDPARPYDSSLLRDPAYQYTDEGRYTVTLQVNDMNGCFDTAMVSLNVLPTPISSFTLTENLGGIPGKIRLNNESEGAKAFTWLLGNGTSDNHPNPVVTYTENGTYLITLVTWNDFNCYDTTFYTYDLVFQSLFVPTAFAPDNLAIGTRLFKPVGINLAQYHIAVFDIFGHMVWESTALDDEGRPVEGWDGTFNHNLMQQGVYMWKVDAAFRNGTVWEGSDVGTGMGSNVGTVTLIR